MARKTISAAIVAALLALGPAPGAQAQNAPQTLCTLVADAETGALWVEEGDCDTRVTPASSFKLALAVMGFDAGLLHDPHAPVMAYAPGDPDWGGADWTRDTDPSDWMRFSVVWYSQRLTRALGVPALTRYAQAFGYGNADFSGDAGFGNGLERAWISSSLRISPREQLAFLRALVTDTLPVAPEASRAARALVETRSLGAWQIHGKTGSAYPRRADRSFERARGWGWYVGWAEGPDGRRLVFARLTQGRERSTTSPGVATREGLLADWPALVR